MVLSKRVGAFLRVRQAGIADAGQDAKSGFLKIMKIIERFVVSGV